MIPLRDQRRMWLAGVEQTGLFIGGVKVWAKPVSAPTVTFPDPTPRTVGGIEYSFAQVDGSTGVGGFMEDYLTIRLSNAGTGYMRAILKVATPVSGATYRLSGNVSAYTAARVGTSPTAKDINSGAGWNPGALRTMTFTAPASGPFYVKFERTPTDAPADISDISIVVV